MTRSPPPTTFADASLRVELKAALAAFGFTEPTPVQAACLEQGLGQDLIVQARTGSGKTLAFGLPILHGLDPAVRAPQAVIVAPTRELAMQIAKALAPLARAIEAQCVTLTGGAELGPQLKGLASQRGAKVVIGTPGRIVDHLQRGSLTTDDVRTVVLDEGDHLLDLGFKDELDAILEAMPEGRRTLLFSATMPAEVEALARRHAKDARKVVIDAATTAHADIEHVAYAVPERQRAEALANLLLFERPDRTVVFCETRNQARELSELLPLLGIPAGLISGELEQRARNRALDSFREGRCHVLVATDVAARGIDVPATTLVVHFTLAGDADTYVHRSGRTGRAGRKGVAVSLVTGRERVPFGHMTRRARVSPTWRELPTPAQIRARRVEALAERLLRAGPSDRTPEAVDAAHRLLAASPGNDTLGLVARLLDTAVDLEGAPGYELEPVREPAPERRRPFDRRGQRWHREGPGDRGGQGGRFHRKGPRPHADERERQRATRREREGDGDAGPGRGPARGPGRGGSRRGPKVP